MKKGLLAAGVILTVLGLAVLGYALFAGGFDLTKLTADKLETNTHTDDGAFDAIDIRTDTADVTFKPSDDGKLRVVCVERETQKHTVAVENGTLKITVSPDQRKWYERIGIFTASTSVTVYLPEARYRALMIDNDTGDVTVPDTFSFKTAEIKTDTGDVLWEASADGAVKIRTDTGDITATGVRAGELALSVSTGHIRVSAVDCAGDVSVTVSTGRTELTDVRCQNLTSKGDTGSITLKNVVAAESFSIQRDTGDVRFDNCDAAEITVDTDTGDVTGTLRTEKVFVTKTDTGSVRVPDSITGGRCRITTDTGDIRIEISGGR